VKETRCEICGEWIKPHEEQAEMYDPIAVDLSGPFIDYIEGMVFICHAQCGLNKGLEVA
jgi:hypothetical protein